MATLVAPHCSAGVQPKGLRVGLVAVTSIYSLAGSLSTSDVIQMIKVPANARPVFVSVQPRCGGTGTGSINVGDGVDTDRYVVGAVLSVSAVPTLINAHPFVPYTYSVDDTIDVIVSSTE